MDTLSYPFGEGRLFEGFIQDRNGGSGESVVSTQFSSETSGSGIKSNNAKLATTDVNIVKVQESTASHFCRANAELLSPEPSQASRKRARTNFQLQNPVCQVRGCNKDLSLSKGYYKRHKVCDVHSKTAVVVVSDLQQRFCQQCSRFHMLEEFDGDKRSCRKRLAGHNKRRRKPQLLTHFGSAYLQTTSPMLFSRMLPGGIFNQQCSELVRHSACAKLENKLPCEVSHLGVPVQFGFSLPKTVLHLNGIVTQYLSSDSAKTPLPVQNLSTATNSSSALFLLSGLNTELIKRYSRYVHGSSSGQ